MSNLTPLTEISSEYWGNVIMYRIAEALNKELDVINVLDGPPVKTYIVDVDELLKEALEILTKNTARGLR